MSMYEEEFADEFTADPQDREADAQRAREAARDRNRFYITTWLASVRGTVHEHLTPADFPTSVVEQFDAFMQTRLVNVLLAGGRGRGKTSFAIVVGTIFARKGRWVEMMTFDEAYRCVFAPDDTARANRLSAAENCNLLILDDFGAKSPHPDQVSRIATIVENRAKHADGSKRTIFTTNTDLAAYEARLDAEAAAAGTDPDPGYAPMKRLLSRMAATTIVFPRGNDLRKETWK